MRFFALLGFFMCIVLRFAYGAFVQLIGNIGYHNINYGAQSINFIDSHTDIYNAVYNSFKPVRCSTHALN